ncbi:MAG: ester cyclase [Flavobacteriales bacterium]|nr:ester cyclase [Flavobacteriales bacterium]
MNSQELNTFAKEYTASWCSQTPSRVATHFAEGGSLTINDGEPSIGREAIAAAAQSFMTAFPDMIVRMDSLVEKRDHIEYHWTLIGTNTGPGGTGRAVNISGYEEWALSKDGLIQRSLGHFDAEEYARQLNG